MIQLLEVSKTYNAGKQSRFEALKDVTLTLDLNEIVVFQGPSGSGKTTLLSLIGCMSRPSLGRISLDGKEVTSLPERFLSNIRRTQFGFIFQNFNLIKGISVLENVMLPGYPLGTKHQTLKGRALDLLGELRLTPKANQNVEALSGGEQQRVAMARALINDPAFIIADEPTAHLDSELAREFLGLLGGLQDKGKTILIASHDPLVAGFERVGRVVDLRDGRLVGER